MMTVPRLAVSLLLLSGFAAASALAQDTTPPVVATRIKNFTVKKDAPATVIKLNNTFELKGVTHEVVRFTTVLGDMDVELDPVDAPKTVANFLAYVNSGAYSDSIFHRSVAGFVIQGGGFKVDASQLEAISQNAPVVNEYKVPNTRGTIAMAKLGSDPNSATNQWFFNEADNSANLDNQNGGFTVFGHVIEAGLSVMDAIADLPVYDESQLNENFSQLPLINFTNGGTLMVSNLVLVDSIAVVPTVPKTTGAPSLLKISVQSNSNPHVVTATISNGNKLTLTYAHGKSGTAKITLVAKDSAKSKVTTEFTVTVK